MAERIGTIRTSSRSNILEVGRSPSEAYRVRRLRSLMTRSSALAAILTLAILVGSGVVAQRALTGPVDEQNRFLPADGHSVAVQWQQADHRRRASVENARLHGTSVSGAISPSLTEHAATVPGQSVADTDWWREVITPSSISDPTPRVRLRSVAADGIRLHAQDWGKLGVVLDPAPIEVPATVAVGNTWSDHGIAAVAAGRRSYQRRSQALKPIQADRAAAGCILVRSETRLTAGEPTDGSSDDPATDWTEDELWCPEAGVVRSNGSFDGTRYRLTPDPEPDRSVDPDLARPADAGTQGDAPTKDWTSKPLSFDRGDESFGPAIGDVSVDSPLSERISVDRAGMLHAVGSNGTDVGTGYPVPSGEVWMHGWSHPGGTITSVTSIGLLTLVSTDRRRLRAYDPYGRVRWTTTLPDLTAVAPIRAPGNRLLVTSIRGDVIMLDALTGSRIWKQHLGGPIAIPPVITGRFVAIGTTTAVTVLDAVDGDQRWTADVSSPIAVAIAGDTVAVLSYGAVKGYAASTGRYRWEQFRDADLREMIALDDQLLLTGTTSIEALTATGRHSWRLPGTPITTTTVGNTIIILGSERITALHRDGSPIAQWSAPDAITDDQHLLPTDSAVLAAGRTDDYNLAGLRLGPPSPERAGS